MGRWIKDNWWLALGALLGALEVILGVGMAVTDESTGSVTAGVIIALLGMAILAGIAVRRRRRRGGDLLMIAGTLPAYPFVWTIVLPVLGVLVAAPAMLDAADASAVGPAAPAPQRASGSDTPTSVLLGALVVAVAVSSLIREQAATVSLLSPAFGVLGAHLLLRQRIGGSILARVGMTAFVASLLTGALLMVGIIVTGIDDGESPITGLPQVVGATVLAAGPVGLVAFVVGTRRSRDRARPA